VRCHEHLYPLFIRHFRVPNLVASANLKDLGIVKSDVKDVGATLVVALLQADAMDDRKQGDHKGRHYRSWRTFNPFGLAEASE